MASALTVRGAISDLSIVSLDRRFRRAAGRLGLRLLAAQADLRP